MTIEINIRSETAGFSYNVMRIDNAGKGEPWRSAATPEGLIAAVENRLVELFQKGDQIVIGSEVFQGVDDAVKVLRMDYLTSQQR